MNTYEKKLMKDLVAKFCDGSKLSRDEISLMQNYRVICTEGKGHQYALTEFGREFIAKEGAFYYKNRERNRILNEGRPAEAITNKMFSPLSQSEQDKLNAAMRKLADGIPEGAKGVETMGEWVDRMVAEQQHMHNMEPVYSEVIRNGLDIGKVTGALRESDPHGKDQHETGAKLDAGKPRLGLVLGAFANALVEVGKVGTYGAQKYTDNGWLDVPKGKARYTDALLRHVLAETNETHDPDTHLLHAAHAAWNALARLELVLRKRGETE